MEEEVRTLAEKGYQEIVLTGIHLSSYGTDFKEEPQDLLELTKRLHQIPGVKRIRFGSLEPRLITEEFVRELSAMEKICPHFHLSLQSGCDATLKRMNRHYTCEDYLYRCGILRKYFRDPAITTDVIVGSRERRTRNLQRQRNSWKRSIFTRCMYSNIRDGRGPGRTGCRTRCRSR